MSIFSILGFGTGKMKDALRRGAIVIDIRIANEFDQGKVKDSINIPVDRIAINLERIRKMRMPVIICSASDSENEKIKSYLKANGVKEVYNGGHWIRLLKIEQSL